MLAHTVEFWRTARCYFTVFLTHLHAFFESSLYSSRCWVWSDVWLEGCKDVVVKSYWTRGGFYFILTVVKSSGGFMLATIHIAGGWLHCIFLLYFKSCLLLHVLHSLHSWVSIGFIQPCAILFFGSCFAFFLPEFLHKYNIVASLGCAVCMFVCWLLWGICTASVFIVYSLCSFVLIQLCCSFPNFPGWMGHMGGNVHVL